MRHVLEAIETERAEIEAARGVLDEREALLAEIEALASEGWRTCADCSPTTACVSHRDEAAAHWHSTRAAKTDPASVRTRQMVTGGRDVRLPPDHDRAIHGTRRLYG